MDSPTASAASPVSASTPGALTRTLTLQRDRVELSPVVASEIGNHMGYIRLSTFSHNAATEMAAAVEALQREGARAFILDLRNNPGGLVTAGAGTRQTSKRLPATDPLGTPSCAVITLSTLHWG